MHHSQSHEAEKREKWRSPNNLQREFEPEWQETPANQTAIVQAEREKGKRDRRERRHNPTQPREKSENEE
jgi:hypothetical protein